MADVEVGGCRLGYVQAELVEEEGREVVVERDKVRRPGGYCVGIGVESAIHW